MVILGLSKPGSWDKQVGLSLDTKGECGHGGGKHEQSK